MFTHNQQKSRYELVMGASLATLDYQREGDNIYLTRVYVPAELRGAGVASHLTQLVVEDIKKHGKKCIPVCPFITTYMRRHPDEF